MARGWQGFAVGFLGLTMLEVVVSGNGKSTSNVAGIFNGVGSFARRFLDPTVPAFNPAPPASPAPSLGPAPSTGQVNPNTGQIVPGTNVAPGAGPGPGGSGYGTGNAPGYTPGSLNPGAGGLYQA